MALDRSTSSVDRDDGDILRVAPAAELVAAAVVAVRAPALAPDALAGRVPAIAQELSAAPLIDPHTFHAIIAPVGAARFALRGRPFHEQADVARRRASSRWPRRPIEIPGISAQVSVPFLIRPLP